MMLEQLNVFGGLGTDTAIVTGTLALTGVFTGWLGYRIRYRGDLHLIAGYRADVAVNEEELTRVVGGVVLAVGAVSALAGLVYPVVNSGATGHLDFWAAYTLIVLVLSGYAVVASRRAVAEP